MLNHHKIIVNTFILIPSSVKKQLGSGSGLNEYRYGTNPKHTQKIKITGSFRDTVKTARRVPGT